MTLTIKQKLQKTAKKLGITFRSRATNAELEELISQVDTSSEENAPESPKRGKRGKAGVDSAQDDNEDEEGVEPLEKSANLQAFERNTKIVIDRVLPSGHNATHLHCAGNDHNQNGVTLHVPRECFPDYEEE